METFVTRLPAVLLWCIAVTQWGFAGTVSAQKIDDIFAGLRSVDAPGAAVLVINDGKPVYQHGYGVTDLRTRNKIDEHTNFRLASVSKQFTAMAVKIGRAQSELQSHSDLVCRLLLEKKNSSR